MYAQDTGFAPPVNRVPANVQTENALLGVLLVDNSSIALVSDFLEGQHFFSALNGAIYDQAKQLIEAGRTATILTLSPYFEGIEVQGEYESLPIDRYLGSLAIAAGLRASMRDYGRTIVEASALRGLQVHCEDMLKAVAERGHEAQRLIEDGMSALYQISRRLPSERVERTREQTIDLVLAKAREAVQRGSGLIGLSTGLRDLDAKLGGLAPTNLIIIAGRPAMGKDQPLDTPILMRSGAWKLMEYLRLGDELASVDGARSVVSGIYPQGKRQMFRVTFSDGRSTETGAEHLWRVWHRKWKAPRVLSTTEIAALIERPDYRNRIWIDMVSGHFGQSSDLPIDPWLLGSLLANGTMTSGKTVVCSGHEWVHEQVAACAGAHRTIVSRRPERYLSVIKGEDHGVNPVLIALRSLGLTGIRSEDKFIPQSYLEASREDRRRLLMGLIDGDGWVEKFGAMRYATSSRRLADDIMILVRSLGGWVSDSVKQPRFTHKGETRQGLPSFVLNIVLDNPEDYVSVPVKRERVAQTGRHKRLNIMSVEPSRVTQSQCITVTHPSRLYVTNDYIVTHNSALAAGIAHSVARSGTPAAIFSLEMSDDELYARLISERAGVSSERLRRGKFEAAHWPAIEAAAAGLKQIPLEIDQTGGLTIGQLATRARRMHRERKLGLIVVDYLQLMAGSGRNRSDNRTNELTEITNGLKALAKELDLPIIALSQLSRQVESRDDKRPQLSDLRESGSIEQDADAVIFVYREEYYLEKQEPPATEYARYADWTARMQASVGTADAIIGKARHGPTGTVKLAFAKELTRFSDLARGQNQ